VDAGVATVMGAYNAVNGFPCCGSRFLLQDTLRDQWKFPGLVVSDAGAIGAFHRHHRAAAGLPADDKQWGILAGRQDRAPGEHVTRDAAESAAFALTSGCDMAIGRDMGPIKEARQRGLVSDADIDASLRRSLNIAMRLGLFDDRAPYTKYTAKDVQSPRHLRLAREAATKGAVLLKNNGVLPLGPNVRTVAVSGPNAADIDVLLGNFYRGVSPDLKTILEGIVACAPEGTTVTYLKGSGLNQPNLFNSGWHIGLAEWADVAVAVIGNSPLMEGESGECLATTTGGDRDTMELPQVQLEYLRNLKQYSKKPVVAVVTGGSPIIMPQVHEIADAVLLVWYPGEQGGLAAGDILFGRANPSGRLSVTFPRGVDQVPDFADYSMKERTYRYMSEDPLYPFGFGLSYSKFTYAPLKLSAGKVRRGRGITATTTVTNTSDRGGEEVVQLYLANHADVGGPRCNLCASQRLTLKAGESKVVRFKVTPDMMKHVDESGQSVLTPGAFTVTVGPCSPGRRGMELGAAEAATGTFTLE
jgi:beta-glucosidase